MYKDVNPMWGTGSGAKAPEFVYGLDAIFASLHNIFSCPEGGRSRIGTPDYWSGVFYLLQEPIDAHTENLLGMALKQAIDKWEPRISWYVSKVTANVSGYAVAVTATSSGLSKTENFNLIQRQA
jgi:phage baseplate assembly protein W